MPVIGITGGISTGILAGAWLVRYAACVGMIWGLFLGTAVMGFSLLLVTIIQEARVIRKKSEAADRS